MRIKPIEIHSHIDTQDGIDLLRRERVDYSLLMWRGEPQLLQLAQANRDVVGLLLWVVPTQPDYLAHAAELLQKHRGLVRGFKLHPMMDHWTVDFASLQGLFALANRENVLIETHTELERCNAARFAPLLEAFPKTKLVLLHGWPRDETFEVIKRYENVYVDTSSTAWGKDYQSAALQAVGKHRIMMGLDSPLGFPNDHGKIQPHFRQAIGEIAAFYDNDPDVADRVLYRNARDLLDSLQR